LCFHTGHNTRNSATSGDVDGGRTTLTSPLINLSGYADAEVSFWLWYSNNRGSSTSVDDELAVDAASNGASASPAWVRVLVLRAAAPIAQATGVWRRYDVPLGAAITLSDQVRVRIIASDLGAGSTVEAALDDVLVRGLICTPAPCTADFNGSGAVSVQDVFDFLTAYFSGDADVNASGATTVEDVFVFLAAWFAGC
jgi:hypothetical protein